MGKTTYDDNSLPRGSFRAEPNERTVIERAGIDLGAQDVADVFNVLGGPVVITAMFMQITETCQTSACNMEWLSDPDVGVDKIIGDTLDITALVAGEYVWAELDGTALVKAQTTVALNNVVDRAAATNVGKGCVVFPGGIDVDLSAALTSGIGHLFIEYRPLWKGCKIVKL